MMCYWFKLVLWNQYSSDCFVLYILSLRYAGQTIQKNQHLHKKMFLLHFAQMLISIQLCSIGKITSKWLCFLVVINKEITT